MTFCEISAVVQIAADSVIADVANEHPILISEKLSATCVSDIFFNSHRAADFTESRAQRVLFCVLFVCFTLILFSFGVRVGM